MSVAAFTGWIAGPDEPVEAQAALQNILGQPPLEVSWRRFSDGTHTLHIGASVQQGSLLVVQRVANAEALLKLLLLIQKLKSAGARRLVVFCPYLFYGRSHGADGSHTTPFSLIAKLLRAAGVDALHILDPHDETILADCALPAFAVSPASLFVDDVRSRWGDLRDLVIVSPDEGSRQRAQRVAQCLNCPLVLLQKKRDTRGVQVFLKDGDVKGRRCVIVDDMVDTGATLRAAAEVLKSAGAQDVGACITHGVLSSGTRFLQDLPLAFLTLIRSCSVPERADLYVRPFAPLVKTLFCEGVTKVG